VNVIGIDAKTIAVTTRIWSPEDRTFVKGPHKVFDR
jgi:hypothetical protein